MYFIRTESSFDSAHFLHGYEGKCRNIHGHRWRVIITLKSDKLIEDGQDRGMVLDFGDVKEVLKNETDKLDHAFIIEEGSLSERVLKVLEDEFKIISLKFRPTAENFSKYFFDKIKEHGFNVKSAEVYETPNNNAIYGE